MDRFADLMDLSSDKSRLDAYFGGALKRAKRAQTAAVGPDGSAATAAASFGTAARCLSEGPAAGTYAGVGAAPAGPAPDVGLRGEQGWLLSGSGAGQDAAQQSGTAPQPGSAVDCASSCSQDAGLAEDDAMSEGSPPPDGAAASDRWRSGDGAAAALPATVKAEDGWQSGQLWDAGGAATAHEAAQREPAACGGLQLPHHGQAEAVSPPEGFRQPKAEVQPCGQPGRPLHAGGATLSRPVSAPAAAGAAPAAGAPGLPAAACAVPVDEAPNQPSTAHADAFALDSVNLREQEAILAMIQARNARRSAVSSSNGGGSCVAAAGGRAASAPVPRTAAKKAVKSPAAEASPPGEKRQRTLRGFLLPRTQACKS